MIQHTIPYVYAALFGLAFCFSSCQSDDELTDNSVESTSASIHVKSADGENTLCFDQSKSFIIRQSYGDGENDGLSFLSASSSGIKVDDHFWLTFYFSKIDGITQGSAIIPQRCSFGFPYSSLGSNYTDEYDGRIILKEWDRDYAIIHFDHVVFHVAYGDCTFNGELRLPVLDQYPGDSE